MDDKVNFNKAERGGKPGVYQIENMEGEKVNMVADVHAMADAYIRMNAKYIKTIEEWRKQNIVDKTVRSQTETKGK